METEGSVTPLSLTEENLLGYITRTLGLELVIRCLEEVVLLQNCERMFASCSSISPAPAGPGYAWSCDADGSSTRGFQLGCDSK